MSLLDHARRELRAIGYHVQEPEPLWKRILSALRLRPAARKTDPAAQDLLNIVALFALQGHSGGSAPPTIATLERLLSYEVLAPLTGEDGEWLDVSEAMGRPSWQNIRCGRVFKGEDGRAYDLEGIVFRDPNGACYTSNASALTVTFPYTPKREYVDVPFMCERSDCDRPATHSLIIMGCAGSPEAKVCTLHAEEEREEGNPFVLTLEEAAHG